MTRKDGYYGPSDADTAIGAIICIVGVAISIALIAYCCFLSGVAF